MTRALRDYQQASVDAVRAAWARGVNRPAAVLATGLGKSSIIAALAVAEARAGGQALLLGHRAELLGQMRDTCHAFDPDVQVGWVQAERDQRHRPIVVAMVQTLASAKRRARMERPTLVVCDEAHHAPAKGWRAVLDWAGCFDETNPTRTLGVTATMSRADKLGLADVWQEVVATYGIDWAIEHGWLVRPRGIAVVTEHVDLAKAKTSRGDWSDGELNDMVVQDVGELAKAWWEHARERSTIAFVPGIESAHALAGEFAAIGVTAEVVIGTTPPHERTRIYARLADGSTRVLIGVGVPTEGFDSPRVSCVLMARPTQVQSLYVQMAGRALRLHPGKADALLLDVCGVTRRHGLKTLPDLLPGADYAEPTARPCARCGLFKHPEDRFDPRCVCPPIERDPTGGRVELIGPQRYEPVDLFGEAVEDTGDVLWLQTRGGIAFVPAKDRIVAMYYEDNVGWRVGHVHRDRRDKGERLARGIGIDRAREVAEQWVRQYCEPTYWSRRAPFRRAGNPPTPGQIGAARAMGIAEPERYNRGALSDLLSIRAASRRLDKR